ncbi:MFS transporter [Cohnella sp. CFH 77786]|uniref:MFS transporter n=1 Tax=Cohnella sp. CFH 77786 TaxID=2662265 RepID=UPI001C608084|nr:MFS transporter [Cohnella sp. CFH 77786]MBW5446351.1 MFS transporter [Cohnella sp. CFH 77786]
MRQQGSALALGLSTMAMTASFVIWSVFSPIAGQIQELFQLSAIEKSVLIATPVLLGSILRIPMGIYTDRFGGKRVFAGTMLFLIIPLLLASFAQTYWLLLLCALFIGMAGTTFAISLTYVSRWFPPERQGFVLGLAGLGNLGGAAASFTLPIVFNRYGLPWVFWGLAVMIAVVTAVFWAGTKDLPLPAKAKTFRQSMEVLKERPTWYLSVFYFLTFGGFVAFGAYLPTFLKDLFHLSATEAGARTAGFVVIATLIRPLGGYLADRIGSRKVLQVVFGGMILVSLTMSVTLHQFAGFSVCCLAAAALLGVGNGAVFKMVPEVSFGNTGAVTGIVGAAGGVGGFFPPIVLGVIKEMTGAYTIGFVMLTCFAFVCLWMNRQTKRMAMAKREAAA